MQKVPLMLLRQTACDGQHRGLAPFACPAETADLHEATIAVNDINADKHFDFRNTVFSFSQFLLPNVIIITLTWIQALLKEVRLAQVFPFPPDSSTL